MSAIPKERDAGRPRDPSFDQALIDAVLDEVAEGATLNGISMVAIARRAGVSRNSLYRRWKTKDSLFLDVVTAINRPIPAPDPTSARAGAADVLDALIERVRDKRASRMLRALSAEADLFPDLHRSYFRDVVTPRRQVMRRVLQQGIDSGELRKGIDIDFASELLVGPILARMASGEIDDIWPQRTSREIVRLVFDGISA
jgi:AcrR family transcriptional regulator